MDSRSPSARCRWSKQKPPPRKPHTAVARAKVYIDLAQADDHRSWLQHQSARTQAAALWRKPLRLIRVARAQTEPLYALAHRFAKSSGTRFGDQDWALSECFTVGIMCTARVYQLSGEKLCQSMTPCFIGSLVCRRRGGDCRAAPSTRGYAELSEAT
jgi:hypothetical protein